MLGRERESPHLFQPPMADQMPDPHQGQAFYTQGTIPQLILHVQEKVV